jgi:prophage maintenance system killer protein/prophage antirepressor-like protein
MVTLMKDLEKNSIAIYKSASKEIEVNLEGESLWLDAHQIAEIFDVQRPAIVKHVNNIYKDSELKKDSTCSILEQIASDGKKRKMNFYNLDMILSVGYRVNSKKATEFRIWATNTLKKHLLNGYTINQKRLQERGVDEFEQAIKLIKQAIGSRELASDEAKGLLSIVTDYAHSWLLLQKYDEDQLVIPKVAQAQFILEYAEARRSISELKNDLMVKKQASELFAQEKDESFKGIIGNIYQTFCGVDLYLGVASKAAHLLYFVIKDHPFVDGNKRSGAFLFILFLAKNKCLLDSGGERKFNDNALVAISLLVAESDPKQKDTMIKLIQNFIS